MRFESEKPSPNSNSGIEVLLEMQAGTDRKRLVARVKESNGHILRTNGNRASWKKAIVTLQDGYSIDILGGDV